jgi:hypothetical protein
LTLIEDLRQAGHDSGEVGQRLAGLGHASGQHETGQDTVAGRAVVEQDHVSGLLAAEVEYEPSRIFSRT